MRYPTLTTGHVQGIVTDLMKGLTPSCDTMAVWRGSGEAVEFDVLDALLDTARNDLELMGTDPSLTNDKEPFEGGLAVAIFPFLHSLPVEVLDDPGFWRYLSVSRFWWFVQWREAKTLAAGELRRVLVYTDGRRNTEQVPLRLYLRVKSVAATGKVELAKELEKCTDFWRSHVIRVRTGTAPELATAFAVMQSGDGRLATGKLRPYAKRLNRMWTNVQLGLYDEQQATTMIQGLRE